MAIVMLRKSEGAGSLTCFQLLINNQKQVKQSEADKTARTDSNNQKHFKEPARDAFSPLAGRLGGVLLLPITAVNNQNQVKEPARGAFSPLAEPEGDLGALFKSKYRLSTTLCIFWKPAQNA